MAWLALLVCTPVALVSASRGWAGTMGKVTIIMHSLVAAMSALALMIVAATPSNRSLGTGVVHCMYATICLIAVPFAVAQAREGSQRDGFQEIGGGSSGGGGGGAAGGYQAPGSSDPYAGSAALIGAGGYNAM